MTALPTTRADTRFSTWKPRRKTASKCHLNTFVRPESAKGPQIVVIQAHGAYGFSQLANFSLRTTSLLRSGRHMLPCHVRGGGELGEAWRLGGKDANKPNTWRDLIACAEDLIARGYTSKEKLFLFGARRAASRWVEP